MRRWPGESRSMAGMALSDSASPRRMSRATERTCPCIGNPSSGVEQLARSPCQGCPRPAPAPRRANLGSEAPGAGLAAARCHGAELRKPRGGVSWELSQPSLPVLARRAETRRASSGQGMRAHADAWPRLPSPIRSYFSSSALGQLRIPAVFPWKHAPTARRPEHLGGCPGGAGPKPNT